MIRGLLYLIIILSFQSGIIAQDAIGQWKDQLSYRSVYQLADAGDRMFCSTGLAMFELKKASEELIRHSKVSGLSDVGISSLQYSEEHDYLIVGYTNGNIDLFSDNGIINLSDIKRSSIIGDKRIYRISLDGDQAWLSCGFGIVVIDLVDLEVKDTYFIGDGGSNIKVSDILVDDDVVYAATETGIYGADRNDNLSDFSRWFLRTEIPNSSGSFGRILRYGDKVLAQSTAETPASALYVREGDQWSTVTDSWGADILDIGFDGDNLMVTQRYWTRVYDDELTPQYLFDSSFIDEDLRLNTGTIDSEGNLWIGDDNHGLINYRGDNDFEFYQPQGPFNDKVWQLTGGGGELYIAHGGLTPTFNNTYSIQGFSSERGGRWSNTYQEELFSIAMDIVDARVDPLDQNKKYFASFLKGVVGFNSSTGEYTLFNEEEGNSSLTYSVLNPERIQVGAIEFDDAGNLWAANSYTAEPFKVRKRNGTWKEFGCEGELPAATLVGEMVVTTEGQTWAVLPRSVGLAVLQHNNELDNTASHQCKKFSTAVGDGALPTTSVLSIAEDLDGEIWIGTSEGPVVNYSPLSVFSSNSSDFQSILVERDGNVERLLGNESISAIEVDGANRKWIGTLTGGLFLLSEDGTEEILHFTSSNSPLYSDVIKDIAIDQQTGAVHIATDRGTLTYIGDATGGLLKNECYDAYPNPVRPDYFGPITIDGLVRNSEVKITDIAGNIVFQTITNGGRVTWDGTDFSGNRVSTGVYFALIADREAITTCISKILFIN